MEKKWPETTSKSLALAHHPSTSRHKRQEVEESSRPMSSPLPSASLLRRVRLLPLLVVMMAVHLQQVLVQAQEDSGSDSKTDAPEEDALTAGDWAKRLCGVTGLVMLSGLFSGLTLGLLSLDKIGLEIVIGAGESESATDEEKEMARCAKIIAPVRENGNLLLTTLLLGNTCVNSLLSIILADLTSGTFGVVISTAVIVTFGEIIPQALCSRYALQIGSKAVPVVKVIILLMYILAKPISWLLDKALGEEIGTIHSKRELTKMLEIHVLNKAIDPEEGHIMHGAIIYKGKTVEKVMTPLEQIYMLPVSTKLNFQTIRDIFKSGCSRIPVWGKDVNDIVGLLFVKDLIFIDPEDETPLLNFIHIFGRGVHKVWPDSKLGDVLKLFKMGKGHLALVYDVNNSGPGDPFYELRGLITLEDIIEEILQDEIVDETDVYVEIEKKNRVARSSFDYGRLRMLNSRIVDDTLSSEEVKAVTTHLIAHYSRLLTVHDTDEKVSEEALRGLISNCSVVDYGPETRLGDKIYRRDEPTSFCTIIMQGKAQILAGREGFMSDVGPWSVLAADCLVSDEGEYSPDFSATVTEGVARCLKISRFDFQRMLYPLSRNSETRPSREFVIAPPEVSSVIDHEREGLMDKGKSAEDLDLEKGAK